jgi:inositol 1,4,5-triphosphate receptor type 1
LLKPHLPIVEAVSHKSRESEKSFWKTLRTQDQPFEKALADWRTVGHETGSSTDHQWYLCATMVFPYYLGMVIVFSFLGFVYHPFFFIFHLMSYFQRPTGRLVLQAISIGAPPLAQTGMMGMLVMFAYASISFCIFQHDTSPPGDDAIPGPASSQLDSRTHKNNFVYLQFVMWHIVEGLRENGDWSEIYGQKRYSEMPQGDWDVFPMLRVLFLLSFFIIWSMLLSNVITGHIIDAFTEIRAERDKRDRDNQEKCFICSIARLQFEQHGAGFQAHVAEEHNPWSYLLYMYAHTQLVYSDGRAMDHRHTRDHPPAHIRAHTQVFCAPKARARLQWCREPYCEIDQDGNGGVDATRQGARLAGARFA